MPGPGILYQSRVFLLEIENEEWRMENGSAIAPMRIPFAKGAGVLLGEI
jgi:hypothetical protein